MEENYIQLATAVIEQAVKDIKDPITIDETKFSSFHPTKKEKEEALGFITESHLFKDIAQFLNIDENKARLALLERVQKPN